MPKVCSENSVTTKINNDITLLILKYHQNINIFQPFLVSGVRGGGRRENRQHFGVFGEIVNTTFSSHFKTF